MQPGPVTATAIAMGARSRYAGTLIAIGHGIIEFPLMVVIIFGMGKYFNLPKVQIAIWLAGGIFLLLMAIQGLLSLKAKTGNKSKALTNKPVLAGIILSAGNPYFLIWWATVGLGVSYSGYPMGHLGLCSFCLSSLVGGPDLAADTVVGEFQGLGITWPARNANSADDLLSGTAFIRPVLYL